MLREQTERLTQMTKTLLEMSNLQQVARNERIQLAPMVEEIFTDLAPLADKRGITLTADGDGVMTGSDALIYRLLFNLTENAVKYNRPGGSVRVCVTQEPEKLLIRVSDTGCGIPEKYQQSIFQPFFRVDKSRSREYGGAGLGLSLVWEIADLHGGSVWVEESSEKGTTIAVELPVQIDLRVKLRQMPSRTVSETTPSTTGSLAKSFKYQNGLIHLSLCDTASMKILCWQPAGSNRGSFVSAVHRVGRPAAQELNHSPFIPGKQP